LNARASATDGSIYILQAIRDNFNPQRQAFLLTNDGALVFLGSSANLTAHITLSSTVTEVVQFSAAPDPRYVLRCALAADRIYLSQGAISCAVSGVDIFGSCFGSANTAQGAPVYMVDGYSQQGVGCAQFGMTYVLDSGF
jgi:hypothetical protein